MARKRNTPKAKRVSRAALESRIAELESRLSPLVADRDALGRLLWELIEPHAKHAVDLAVESAVDNLTIRTY